MAGNRWAMSHRVRCCFGQHLFNQPLNLYLLSLFQPHLWSLFASCSFALITFALRHGRSAGWERPTTLMKFTATVTNPFYSWPSLYPYFGWTTSDDHHFLSFFCSQWWSFLRQLYGSGLNAQIFKQMFWALLVSHYGNRGHALVSSLLAYS